MTRALSFSSVRTAEQPVPSDVERADIAQQAFPELSLVVPMYNEEEVIPALFPRLEAALAGLDMSYEVICISDGSTDRTLELLQAAHRADPRIKVINFSRNFGKEVALTAGLDFAQGQAVVPIDADLQDPPELIATFVERWRAGADVVYGVRSDRHEDSLAKRLSARIFYAVVNKMSKTEIAHNAGDFRLLDRRVVDSIKALPEGQRFMKGLFSWVGFRQEAVPYARPKRAAGTTKFNYWRLWNFALDGITGYSTLPLRIAGYIGLLTAFFAFFYGLILLTRTLILGVEVPGYASLMVTMVFLGGIQLTVLGVIGEYLGRTYEEIKNRPLYIVESTLGLPQANPTSANAPRQHTTRFVRAS